MMFQKQLSPYNLNENLWQPGGETHISAFTEEKNKDNAIYMFLFFFLSVSKGQLLFLASQIHISLAKLHHLLSCLWWKEW